MSSRHLTHAELRGEQDQTWHIWKGKEQELTGSLAKLFWLSGLLAGADREALEAVLGGGAGLPDSEVEAAETGALALLNAHAAKQDEARRLFGELYRLAAEATTAGSEAATAAGDFVHTLDAELKHLSKKHGVEVLTRNHALSLEVRDHG